MNTKRIFVLSTIVSVGLYALWLYICINGWNRYYGIKYKWSMNDVIQTYATTSFTDITTTDRPLIDYPGIDKKKYDIHVVLPYIADSNIDYTSTIKSLLLQTVRIDRIILIADPTIGVELNQETERLVVIHKPSCLHSNTLYNIASYVTDLTKDALTYNIAVQPNIIYGEDFIYHMIDSYNNHHPPQSKPCSFGSNSVIMTPDDQYMLNIPSRPDTVEISEPYPYNFCM